MVQTAAEQERTVSSSEREAVGKGGRCPFIDGQDTIDWFIWAINLSSLPYYQLIMIIDRRKSSFGEQL